MNANLRARLEVLEQRSKPALRPLPKVVPDDTTDVEFDQLRSNDREVLRFSDAADEFV